MKYIIFLIILLFILELGAGFAMNKNKNLTDNIQSSVKQVSSQNEKKLNATAIQLPLEDVPGADIPGIKRYQYLVRTKYQIINGVTQIEYQSHQSSEVILSYYKSALAQAGWILQEAKEGSAIFTKGSQQMRLNASNQKGVCSLSISF